MVETWLDRDVTSRDLEDVLQALSISQDRRVPVFAVSLDGDENASLILADPALFRLFGVTDAGGLAMRLLGSGDPGAKRLSVLARTLPSEGAPRLERLRFFIGPGSDVITFLCRRSIIQGRSLFMAAALGLPSGLTAEPAAERSARPVRTEVGPAPRPEPQGEFAPPADPASDRLPPRDAVPPEPDPQDRPPRDAAALQADLRRRWPAKRTLRFLWQTDADATCTLITPPLAEVVGGGTADLVGRNLLDLASQLDPTGRLASRLEARETWSGLDLRWPLADAAATVLVTAGAIPALDHHGGFEGFRGFGVIHLDRVEAASPVAFPAFAAAPKPPGPVNVVAFPTSATILSSDEQVAFEEIGATLRQRGLVPVRLIDAVSRPSGDRDVATAVKEPDPTAARLAGRTEEQRQMDAEEVGAEQAMAKEAVAVEVGAEEVGAEADHRPSPEASNSTRQDQIGRNGLAMFDKLSLGLLVSRDNVPIFANRFLLDMLDFADEDALHEAGGMTRLFGGLPGNRPDDTVGVRGRTGAVVAVDARMQAIDWDGLPATLLTLKALATNAAEHAAEGPPDPGCERDGKEAHELRAILETATDGVAVLDADCNVLSLNRSGEALFGCDRGEVIGKPFLSLFAPHNQGLASEYFEGLKSSATKTLLNDGREILVRVHQGGTIPVFMTLGRLAPLVEPEADEGARFCALFRDLTHWKKVERELDAARQDAERTSARKSDFLAKVSHEIRTPLNAIIGFAEVMMDERFGPLGNERYKEYLKDIHGSGTHVMSIVNDLLDLSKIEAGKMDLHPVVADANAIITDCVGIMQPQASRERVIMRLSLATTLPHVRADERSLRQIVLNLLSNAVKFNEPGGQVIVATALTEAGHVVIRIRDTGPGMSDADIEAALEPFRQLSTTRSAASGTGLGLPLTKALVEANQASLTIRSRVDHGTLVEVAFPPSQVAAGEA